MHVSCMVYAWDLGIIVPVLAHSYSRTYPCSFCKLEKRRQTTKQDNKAITATSHLIIRAVTYPHDIKNSERPTNKRSLVFGSRAQSQTLGQTIIILNPERRKSQFRHQKEYLVIIIYGGSWGQEPCRVCAGCNQSKMQITVMGLVYGVWMNGYMDRREEDEMRRAAAGYDTEPTWMNCSQW